MTRSAGVDRLAGAGFHPAARLGCRDAVIGGVVTELIPEDIGALAMAGLDDVPADLQGSASYRNPGGCRDGGPRLGRCRPRSQQGDRRCMSCRSS